MKGKDVFLIGGLLSTISATLYELIEHGVPIKRNYNVFMPSCCSGLSFLMLSDLHENRLLTENEPFLKQLSNEKPDVILIPGDIVNKTGKGNRLKTLSFLKRLSEIAPVVVSKGNHEQELQERNPDLYESIRSGMPTENFYFLDNDKVTLILRGKKVSFFGLTPSTYVYKRKKTKWIQTNLRMTEKTDVLLSHNPDLFPEVCKNASLVVSGHNHGGIIRLPGIKGLFSPQQFLPRYTRGCYYREGSTLVVSAGIGSHTLPARLFNRVEFCVIKTKTRKAI